MSERDASSWQVAFVATTLLLGDTIRDAKAALSAPHWAVALAGAPTLEHADKAVRARAIAAVLAEIASGLEELRLA